MEQIGALWGLSGALTSNISEHEIDGIVQLYSSILVMAFATQLVSSVYRLSTIISVCMVQCFRCDAKLVIYDSPGLPALLYSAIAASSTSKIDLPHSHELLRPA